MHLHVNFPINNIHFAYSYASWYASSSPSFSPLSYASSYAATLIPSKLRTLIWHKQTWKGEQEQQNNSNTNNHKT